MPRLCIQAAVFSQRMPPVQYMATRLPCAFQAGNCASTQAGKSRKLLTCGSTAPLKRPSRNSKLLRLSISTTSSCASSSRQACGLSWVPTWPMASTPSTPSGKTSGLLCTFMRWNGALVQPLRLQAMPLNRPARRASCASAD